MASQADVAAQIVGTLALTDPDLDTSVGTTTRKIIDAVSEQIAEGYIDQHMLSYQYDIDAKNDADLDAFVQLFGLSRFAAKRATGTVIFSRSTSDATRAVVIPVNTQIGSSTSPQVIVATVTPAIMDVGVLSVSVPVQAVEGGPEGNLGAGLLTTILTPISGVPLVSNIDPLTGGAARESDTELRLRFKKTVFRSLAGTEQMYLGVALDHPNVTQANVVGASRRRREQVQIVGGEATSTLDDAAYIFPQSSVVGANIDGGDVRLRGVHYTFDSSVNPPKIVTIGTGLTEGGIYDLDFEYTPLASRNTPSTGITNRVDVWHNGTKAQAASQSVVFLTSTVFTGAPGDPYDLNKFIRHTGTRPTANNIFIPLAYGPIITLPSTLVVNGVTYDLYVVNPDGTNNDGDYYLVHRDDSAGGMPTSLFGIEWRADRLPVGTGHVFTVGTGYTFNLAPTEVQAGIDRWRLLGVDARAHQAFQVYLRFNLAVMYDARASQVSVDERIDAAIESYLARTGFTSTVQVSDVLQAVHNVPGVDNVRFLNATDNTGYNSAAPNDYDVGIQRLLNGAVVESYVDATTGRAKDVHFGDSELPVFGDSFIVAKAQNSWGVA